jgi:outer membrane protein OmpA-like peptidoglycan-associated protein
MTCRKSLLVAAVFVLSSAGLLAQTNPANAPPVDASVPITYVGSNARVSLGVDEHGDVLGEILGILGKTDEHAWLADLWLGQGGSGGVQLDYHWLHGSAADAIEHPDRPSVWKVFGAVDQDAWKDRKATVGLGWQKNDFSVDGYVMKSTTGARLISSAELINTTQINGSDTQGEYVQTQTIDTLTQVFEHPYDNGIGMRLSQYLDDPLLRIIGGVDYERGKYSSDQWTLSLGVDKYIANSGFSVSLLGEALHKSGRFETSIGLDRSDARAWLLLRYDIGQNYRPREQFQMVETQQQAPPESAPPTHPQVVRNEVKLDGDAFFDFDRHNLRPDAIAALDELIAKLKSSARVSRVSIVGHTDAIGTVEYNQVLSERRAESAKRYLVEHGIEADQIDTRGEGKLNPSYPNDTAANRQKNRRVDVEFLTIEETTTTPPPEPQRPGMEWVKEPLKVPPAWIERALRDPAEHKRTVDVYQFEKTTNTTTLGPKQYLHPPVAKDVSVTVDENSTDNPIDVLSSASDPNGYKLTVTGVSTPAHGAAAFTGTNATYTPATNYLGADSFTYTVSNGHGGTATATVHITVVAQNAQSLPPVAKDLSITVNENSTANPVDVLSSASDPSGGKLTVTAVSSPTHGTAAFTSTGATYTPATNYLGADNFTYTVSNGSGGTATATVHITVVTQNLPPVAGPLSVRVLKDTSIDIPVLQAASDPQGFPLTVIAVKHTGPLPNNTVSINSDGTVHYQSIKGWFGQDYFEYTVSDGHGQTATGTVSVYVYEEPAIP